MSQRHNKSFNSKLGSQFPHSLRTQLQGGSPLFVTAWGMIGGFGVSANIQGDVLGAVGYEITDRFSFIAGYRAAGVDYSDSDFTFDTLLHGPVVAAVINF